MKETITQASARFGVFTIPNTAAERDGWRCRRFGPLEIVASATDRHAAAMAACLYLAAVDDPREALIVRCRVTGRNLALIEWNHQAGPGPWPAYRFSSETWADL